MVSELGQLALLKTIGLDLQEIQEELELEQITPSNTSGRITEKSLQTWVQSLSIGKTKDLYEILNLKMDCLILS